ncbi:LRP2-binding protein-like [Mizuhopecten yessoensis]|uniref:LRP2-binding protein n=1 Tax=Mizuhopecten yessoensis TaxID=6573 RepID=A0A210PPF6_MIZYE|nr:LRP2-binding protein-like [Mizuhopecten yessoensis]OWF38358.1 LRP2-binding protein [Mizuhopecten yessoensis]
MEMHMEIPADLALSKENSILNDLKQETRDTPGFSALTENELMEKVENILLERIKNGDKRAYFQLGLFYYEQALQDKARIYFERAKDFDFQALFMLAVMLFDGVGGDTNTEQAIEYLKKIESSNAKHAKHLVRAAQFNIGRAYFQGYGVHRQSDEMAEKYWLLAADDGNPNGSVKAQSALGMFYSLKDTMDLKKAFFWHSEACGNGSLESQGALGIMYEHGIGVKVDLDAANACLKEAAERGNVYAMGHLVAQYYRRKLFTKASDLAARVSQFSDIDQIAKETDCLPNYIRKGIGLGCFYYARCLEEGHGVKQDKEEAGKCYSKSFEYDPDVCATLQNITQHGVI